MTEWWKADPIIGAEPAPKAQTGDFWANDPVLGKDEQLEVPAPGVGDYVNEIGRTGVRSLAGLVSSGSSGFGVLTSDTQFAVDQVEKELANLDKMSLTDAQKLYDSLGSRLSPVVAFNYRVGIRKALKGDKEGANSYFDTARRYIDTRPVDEQSLTKGGKQLEEAANKAFPQDPRFKGSLTSDLTQAGASSLGLLPIGLLTGGTGVAVTGAALGADQSYRQAKQAIAGNEFDDNGNRIQYRDDRGGLYNAGYGAEAEQKALEAGRLGAIPGASEIVPTEVFLEQMPKLIPGLRTIASTPVWGKFAKAFGRIGSQVLTEGGQEAFQQWASNVINNLTIDPSQDVTEDVLYNALIGGAVGGGMQTAVEGYNAAFGKPEPAAPPPGAPPPPAGRQRIEPTLFPGSPPPAAPGPGAAAPPPGAGPAPAAPAAPPPMPPGFVSDDAYLAGAGWSPEQIADMSPEERLAAVEEARQQGVEPVDIMAGAPQPGTAPRAPRGTRGAKRGLEQVPNSVFSAFPDMQQTVEGYISINGFTQQERDALRNAGLIQGVTNADGETYEAVDPEALWPERQKRANVSAQNRPGVTDEQFNQGVENRARTYDRLAEEQEKLGELGDQEAAAAYRAKAAEIRATSRTPGTRKAKQSVQTPEDLDAVRPVVNAEPSAAQAQAGNYQKGHIRLHGMDISIENPRGSVRRSKDENDPWQSPELPADYGYIKRTTGKDGDHVDVYIGPNPASDRVFVVDQMDLKTGKFDEHKSVLGADSVGEAIDLYVKSFDNPTLDRVGNVTEMSVDEFRQWVKDGKNMKRPAAKAGVGTVTPNSPEPAASVTPPPPLPPGPATWTSSNHSEPVIVLNQPPQMGQDGQFYQPVEDPQGNPGLIPFSEITSDAAPDELDAAFEQAYAAERGGQGPSAEVAPVPDRSGFTERKPRKSRTLKGPLDGLTFIASIGGITDPTGELRGMDLHKVMTTLGPVLRNRTGLHPDKVREALIDGGFIRDRGVGTTLQQETTLDDVYEFIRKAISEKVYSERDQADADSRAAERRAENQNPDLENMHPVEARWGADVWQAVQDAIAEFGYSTDDYTMRELDNVGGMIAQGMDAGDAFERNAIMVERSLLDQDEDMAPEITAAFERTRLTAMLDFQPSPPAWDLEESDAAQQQGPQADLDGVRPASPAGDETGSAAEAADAGAAARTPREDGGEAGSERPAAEGVTEQGPFGPIFYGYEGRWQEAALRLEEEQSGEAPGAVSHPDVGPIALVWGEEGTSRSDGYGLAKILAWHPEVLEDLQGAIDRMEITSRSENRIQLASKEDKAAVRLDWDGQQSVWLISAFKKTAPRRTEKFTGSLSDLWAGLAQPDRRGEEDIGQPAGSDNTTPTTEQGADNRPQMVIPGAEQDIKGALNNAVNAPLKGKAGQKDMDVGLFGSERNQTDLFDAPKKTEQPADDLDAAFEQAMKEETGAPQKTSAAPVVKPNLTTAKRLVIQTGVVLRTKSGRETSPAPKIEATNDRKTLNTLNRMYQWLLDEARKEVAGDNWQTQLLRGIDIKNLSPADQDQINLVLFGDPDGATEENVIRVESGRKPKSAGQAAAGAVKNTGLAIEDAVKGLEALFGGKNKLSSGFTFDEETYAKALPFFRAAASHIKDAGADAVAMFRALIRKLTEAGQSDEAILNMKPFLKRFVEDVRAGKVTLGEEEPVAAPQQAQEGKFHPIVNAFVDYLSQPDAAFDTITEARKFAADRGFKVQPGTPEAKELDEMLELAIVLTARTLVGASKKRPVETAYRRLVDLYQRQPNLGVRTSESIADQAYSTPAPLAFIASRLAGVATAKDVLEPTAGNGMLLIEATPSKATVNEINDRRRKALDAQGFRTTQKDAATESLRPKGDLVDSIIANPPFGAVQQSDGSSKTFTFDGWNTTQIDHVIALNALQNLKDDGRAVLIVGSVKEGNDKSRSDSYNTKQKREFYWRLYQGYNVTDHFTVAGDLYKRQGAGWPVDVIVIEGKGKSTRPLPAVELPKIYDTWESLKEKLNEAPAQTEPGARPPVAGNAVSGPSDNGNVPEDGSRLEGGSTGNQSSNGGRGASSVQPPARGQGAIPDGGNQRELADSGQQQSPEPDSGALAPGERPDGDGNRQSPVPLRERLTQEAGAAQQPYQPMSGQKSLDTKIPTNMADAVQTSLEDLADRYGDLDVWLEKELGYKKGEIGKYLAAEQVDAVALAIDNVKKNAAFIIGDQTGIGKGRVVASALRYAMRNGLVPIFVTEKPNLYGDMIRDLNDIGVPEMLGRDVQPFLTNAGSSIPLDDEAVAWFEEAEKAKAEGTTVPPKRGKFLRASGGDLHKRQMAALQAGSKDFDIIFTTYDQLNTVKGQTTDRRRLVDGIADRAFIVLDESHNAGGTEAAGWQSDNAPENRSDFIKKVLGKAKAVMFSSATYAKRPGVMALYARTDMGKAVESPDMLGGLIAKGGVPMQQVVAAMLAKAGQYIRRERSFDGVSYDVQPVAVDAGAYDAVSTSIATIARFDMEIKKSDVWDDIKEKLKEEAAAMAMDSGMGEASVKSINFTSLMHNIVNQMLLAIKTDAVADLAIEALKNNEKPVITVSNTMGSFLKTFAEDNDIKPGDAVNLSFRNVLQRYLERTRRLTIKRPDGTKYHYTIPLSALPGYMQKAYADAEQMIGNIDTTNLPISPIDWLHYRLRKAGYRTAEITGRKEILEYGGPDDASFAERMDSEISPGGRRVAIDKYNRGALDVMILNRAGSTGLSLHASVKFKDQRRRRMIIAQAEGNIDVHMQMLGRVHRTGQVIPPAFVQAYADVPAEARPAAVLAKKMASLNANTTASRKSAFSADDSVDFLNEYGDQVAREYLKENPDIGELVNVKVSDEAETARELTGRLLLLPVADQRTVLDEISARYKALIENLDAMGENALEAKTMDLEAKTTGRSELKAAEGESPFTQAVILEEVEVKSVGKALPLPEILTKAAESLGIKDLDTANPASALNELERTAQKVQPVFAKKWLEDFDRMVADELKNTKADDVRQQRREKHAANRDRFNRILDLVLPGRRVTVMRATETADPVIGIIMNVQRRGQTGATGNPLALGAWTAEIAIPDNAQRVMIPFSAMYLSGEPVEVGATRFVIGSPDWAMGIKQTVEAFEKARQTGKETRYIVTGNILAGFDQTKGRGQIVNYTDDKGNVKPGILMARTFDPQAFLNQRAIRFKTASQVLQFLKQIPASEIVSHDDIITVRVSDRLIEIETPSARQSGGTYFLNPEVRRASRDQFTKIGSRMRYRTSSERDAQAVLEAMMQAGAVFQTVENQEAAEAIINGGQGKPTTLSSRKPTRLSSVAKKPVFYSGLLRAVEGMKQNTAPKTQWMGMIRNAPGVKAEEIAWIGLEDWLSQQSGQITKQQITDFIKANQVEVKEVVKGEPRPISDRHKERVATWIADNFPDQYDDEGAWLLVGRAANGEAESIGDLENLGLRSELIDPFYGVTNSETSQNTKFSTYQLPGGKNYRELLLTLPAEKREMDWREQRDQVSRMSFKFKPYEELTDAEKARFAEIYGTDADFKRRGSKTATGPEAYRSSHFDEPNILAHIRFNERTDADGKRVLFVEEIQSDWHQAGRKQGYGKKKSPITDEMISEARSALNAELKEADLLGFDNTSDARSAILNHADWTDRWDVQDLPTLINAGNRFRTLVYQQREADLGRGAVPDAPFKTTWPELAMKRVIRWAAENGFDRVAWTPGEVQAERYDLSKQISSLSWYYQGGLVTLEVEDLKGRVYNYNEFEPENALDELIGKEMGDKIRADINAGKRKGSYTGLDLRVGGKGMIGFYDKILVDTANRLGKKWGVKVGKLTFPEKFKKTLAGFGPIEPAVTAHSLDITPEMARAAMEGQPLFKQKDAETETPAVDPQTNPYKFALGKKQAAQLTAELHEVFNRIAGKHSKALSVVADQKAWEASFGTNTDGEFDIMSTIIYVALQGDKNPFSTLRHEIIHALRQAGVFTAREWALLSKMAREHWIDQLQIRERYAHYGDYNLTKDQLEALLIEEAIADAFSYLWQRPTGEDVIGRIVAKVRDLLEAIQNLFRGYGFTTVMQVFGDVEAGRIAARARNSGQGRGFLDSGSVQSRRQDANRPSSLSNRRPGPTSAPADDGGRGGFAQAGGADDDMLEFAGNINLNYIDAPEAVKDVLRDAARQADGFIRARRGVVSHDQTRELAELSGMSLDKLLSRQTGEAWNAHEIYAARAMLIKSASIVKQAAARARNTTSDVDRAYFMRVLTRHAAIQEQIAGMTAEAGRALNQFKMLAGADYIRGVTEMLSERTRNGRVGPEAIREMADAIDGLDTPGQVGRMTREMFRPGFWDMIREYYINSLLSGPTTQTVNFISNMLTALNQIPESFVAEQIGKLHGGQKVERGETIARAFGLLEGSREGFELAIKTLQTGESHTPETQFDQPTQKAIPGLLGEVVRMPSRFMMSTDDFYKAVNYRAELNALAVRLASREGLTGDEFAARVAELRDDPTPQMIRKATEAAKYQTFQTKLGPMGQTLMRLRESWHLWMILPFLRTPINILKYATERSPLGPLLMKDVREALSGKKGGAARDIQIARIMLGTVIMTGMAAFVIAGNATGGGDDDDKKKAVARASGWQPYSIKVGDTYYSYLRFDPFSLHLGIVADMVEFKDRMTDGDYAQLPSLVLSSIVSNIVDKTWLKGATEFTKMLQDPKASMTGYVSHLASGFVPNLFAQIARVQDPTFRDARTLMDKIKERVPGYRQTLPPRIDIFGDKIISEGNLGPDLFSPVYISSQKDNPVARAMVEADYFPGPPRRHMNGHDLTPDQYAIYSEIAGRQAVKRLTKIVTAPNWAARPQEVKEKIIKKHYDEAREFARDNLKRAFPELRQPGEN